MSTYSEIQTAIDELYSKGLLVKALEKSGEPLLRNGKQVYKCSDFATAAELAYWRIENNVD